MAILKSSIALSEVRKQIMLLPIYDPLYMDTMDPECVLWKP